MNFEQTSVKSTNDSFVWVSFADFGKVLLSSTFVSINMKKRATLSSAILFLIVSLTLCSIKSHAQWTQVASGTSSDLNEIYFPVPDTGFIVGNQGVVLKTTNGGQNWTKLQLNVNVNLLELYFLDANTGWLVGDAGTICKTTDGGATWSYHYLDSAINIDLQSVFALNSSDVIVGGSNTSANDYIFKSVDGGLTWQSATVEKFIWAVSILKIGMVSNTVGYAASRGFILKTTDGGWNWRITDTTSVFASAMFTILEDIAFFPGSDTLFTCGWYPAYLGKTSNGGQNWSHSLGYDYTNLDFVNPNVGYVGGWGVIHKTIDGGLTYIDASAGDPLLFTNVLSIDFTDEWRGYACGKNGLIIKTNNGGATGLEDDNANQPLVVVYPNPSSNFFHLSDVSNVMVTDIVGKVVFEESSTQVIDLSEKGVGVYFVHITDNSGKILQRSKIIRAE